MNSQPPNMHALINGQLLTWGSQNWLNVDISSWWSHQMETFSALLALYAGNSPVPGECPSQRSVTRIFDVFFDLRLNIRLSKQSWGWWFDTPSRSLWRHCNVVLRRHKNEHYHKQNCPVSHELPLICTLFNARTSPNVFLCTYQYVCG